MLSVGKLTLNTKESWKRDAQPEGMQKCPGGKAASTPRQPQAKHTVQWVRLKQALVQPPTTLMEPLCVEKCFSLMALWGKTTEAGDTGVEEPLTHDTCTELSVSGTRPDFLESQVRPTPPLPLEVLALLQEAMLSHFSCVQPFSTPWTLACQASLSMGFPRQEYLSGLPFPPLGDLPDPGTEPSSFPSPALTGRFFPGSATREALQEGGTRQSSHCRLFPCDSTKL